MGLEIDKTVQYWLEGAQYDLETGKSLIEAKRFPYSLFFGHLAIEKLLKAFFVKNRRKHAPYSHSLTFLAEESGLGASEEIMDKLAEFTEFNIEARYPEEQKKFYEKCTQEFAEKKFEEIEEVYQWLHQKL